MSLLQQNQDRFNDSSVNESPIIQPFMLSFTTTAILVIIIVVSVLLRTKYNQNKRNGKYSGRNPKKLKNNNQKSKFGEKQICTNYRKDRNKIKIGKKNSNLKFDSVIPGVGKFDEPVMYPQKLKEPPIASKRQGSQIRLKGILKKDSSI